MIKYPFLLSTSAAEAQTAQTAESSAQSQQAQPKRLDLPCGGIYLYGISSIIPQSYSVNAKADD